MNTAHLCARISELAYEDDPTSGLALLGYDLVKKYDRNGTQAILVTDAMNVILAFPGTDEVADVRYDLAYVKCDFPGGGRVHRGFYRGFTEIWDDIAADLIDLRGSKIFTGHSLGAGYAVMAAVLWPPGETHVFGCPKVGNKDFVRRVHRPLTRYENWFDVVTYLPPANSPRQAIHAISHGRAPTLYRHAGKKVGLRGFGHFIRRYVRSTRKLGLRVAGV